MIYEFSDLRLDLDRYLLTRGEKPVKLTKLSFKVLQVLVQAAPALVSHDDLITGVWGPNRMITPENLSQRMTTLRKSLGDDPNKPIYIEGVRGAGYRLVPDVIVRSSETPSHAPGRTRFSLFVAGLVVVLAVFLTWSVIDRIKSGDGESMVNPVDTAVIESPAPDRVSQPTIAVLPFTDLSENQLNQYFTDGIHDDLLTRISNIQDIKTISRTSVMTYRGSNKTLGEIAQELGVSAILEGGVQRAGDQVRINLQLIDAASDVHLWAHTFTRELTAANIFVVQAEITEAVAGALQTVLTEDEQKQVEKLPTTNLRALEAYFMGNQFFSQETSEGITKAIVAYQTAIKLDSEFALAYSKQAHAVLQQIYYSGFSAKTQLEKSRPLIDQAILLDPQSSEAFNALGRWHKHSGDAEKAVQAFERAMALGPNNAYALANYGSTVFDPASAINLFRRAIELDPQNIGLKRQLARALPSVGLAGEGIRILEGIAAEHPGSAAGYRDLALIYSNWEFRHDRGIKTMRRAFELDPDHPTSSYWNAIMHWRLGDYDNTALWMNHIASLIPDRERARVYRGWAFLAQSNIESARREFDRPNLNSILYWMGVFYLGGLDTKEGRPDDAIERYRDYAEEFDGKKSNVNFYFGIVAIKAYQALGEQEKAQALLDELISIIDANPSVTYHDSAIHDASIYALAGQEETAIATLEEWVNRGGATSLLEQDIRHGLSVLEDDPRYQSILDTVKNRLSEQKANLDRWEASGEMPPIPEEVSTPE